MIFGLIPLLILGLIVWAIVAAARRFSGGDDQPVDAAASFRRLFVYLLLLAALAITATGVQQILEILLDAGTTVAADDSARQARGLSFLLIGTPSFVLLYRHVLGRLRSDPSEERSLGWRLYLNATLGISLITAMATAANVIRMILGVDDYSAASLATLVVASAVWLFHWFGPLRGHPLPSGFHLAVGSLAGLAATTTGLVLLLLAAGDAVYDAVANVTLAETAPLDRVWQAVSGLVVGLPVWWWHWLRPSRREWERALWNGYVMIAGVLAGAFSAVGSAYAILTGVVIWIFGDREGAEAAAHFEFVPTAVAFGLAGIAVWAYHSWVYDRAQAGRTEAARVYEYTMAAVGLIAAAGGIATLIVAFLQTVGSSAIAGDEGAANVLIAAICALLVGAPLWWFYWRRIERHRAADPAGEAESISRRIYTLALFGVSAIVGFVSLIVVAFITFEDLFDGVLGQETVTDARVGIALAITAGLLSWYHFGVYRKDRALATAVVPVGPKRITMVGALPDHAMDALRDRLDSSVRVWRRTDDPGDWTGDAEALIEALAVSTEEDVLLLLGPDDVQLVPYRVR